MTNLEIIELYKTFLKERNIKEPGIIPRVYDVEDTLKDIFSSIYGSAFRAGKKQGFDEGFAYQPEKQEDEKY
jgi:hypothetical protein